MTHDRSHAQATQGLQWVRLHSGDAASYIGGTLA